MEEKNVQLCGQRKGIWISGFQDIRISVYLEIRISEFPDKEHVLIKTMKITLSKEHVLMKHSQCMHIGSDAF